MTVAYDGTPYRGFAIQNGVPTVGGALVEALQQVLGRPLVLRCAGRTDAGVHAWGQVISFDAPEPFDAVAASRSLNRMLGPTIVVRDAAAVGDHFDARRSARSRRYRYTVLNRPVGDPFLAATTWHVDRPLDLPAMRAAGDPLIGEHDFSSFCRAPSNPDAGLVRRVLDLGWQDLSDGLLRFEIEATSFCQQMVRSVVGTMVEMGLGRKRAGEMAFILRARDRGLAASPAPPQGLCLWEVRYPPEPVAPVPAGDRLPGPSPSP